MGKPKVTFAFRCVNSGWNENTCFGARGGQHVQFTQVSDLLSNSRLKAFHEYVIFFL